MRTTLFLSAAAILLSAHSFAYAQEKESNVSVTRPLAIFPFQERGAEVKGHGAKVTDILFAELIANENLMLVDREDIKKIVEEQELSLTGLVNPAEANQVGHLTGAKILVTGSVLQTDKTVYVVAKMIGTENGRVLGASVKGIATDPLDTLVAELAGKVASTLAERADELVPERSSRKDRLIALQKRFPQGKRPVVYIAVSERHVGQPAIDPAVQTELSLCCKELGFEVLDPETAARNQADIVISGEGMSEVAGRVGNLTSVKARVELKATDQITSQIVAMDREVAINVDLTEQIAGKGALQEAAVSLAERILPKLVKTKKK